MNDPGQDGGVDVSHVRVRLIRPGERAEWDRGGPQPLDRISRSLSGLSAGLVKRLDPRTLCKPATVSADPVLDDVSHYCRNESI